MKNHLQSILSISEGTLPVRYLGVPLITSRLLASDCQVLVTKILERVLSWSNKLLSYGGRAELVSSVLFSIQCYWSSIFVLPKKVLSDVERILRSFFWTGPDMKSSGAKVSWDSVCLPKPEGGLGFRRLKDWNVAAMTKYIWALAKKADTLWIKWVHMFVIKTKCMWTMKVPVYSSWTIKKIFKLRAMVQPWIKCIVGNGSNTFLWWDNWHPVGPLFQKFGERLGDTLHRASSAKVSSVIAGNNWNWPNGRSAIVRAIERDTPSSFLPNVLREDSVRWCLSPTGYSLLKLLGMPSALLPLKLNGIRVFGSSIMFLGGL